MISIQRIDGQGQSAKKLYSLLMKEREKRCPGQNATEIIHEAKNQIIYKAITRECAEFGPQAEISVIFSPSKLILMQYTLWKVEYVVKYENYDDFITVEKLDWIKGIELLVGKELDSYLNNN